MRTLSGQLIYKAMTASSPQTTARVALSVSRWPELSEEDADADAVAEVDDEPPEPEPEPELSEEEAAIDVDAEPEAIALAELLDSELPVAAAPEALAP